MPNSQNEKESGGDTPKRCFASMDDDKQRDIASKGGQLRGETSRTTPSVPLKQARRVAGRPAAVTTVD